MTPIPIFSRALVGALVLAALGGCEVFKHNEEAVAIVNTRILGMPVGDFFDRYGKASVRDEHPDGSVEYLWTSDLGLTPPGPGGVDDRICRMRLSADPRGKISGIAILFDSPGRKSVSRCGEIFAK